MDKQEFAALATRLGLPANSKLGDIRAAFNKLVEQEIELEKNPPKSAIEKFEENLEKDDLSYTSCTEIETINELADVFLYYILTTMTLEEKAKAKKIKEAEYDQIYKQIVDQLIILENITKIWLNGNKNFSQKTSDIFKMFLNNIDPDFKAFTLF